MTPDEEFDLEMFMGGHVSDSILQDLVMLHSLVRLIKISPDLGEAVHKTALSVDNSMELYNLLALYRSKYGDGNNLNAPMPLAIKPSYAKAEVTNE